MKAGCKMTFEGGRFGEYSSVNWELHGKRQEVINNEIILRGMKSSDCLDLVRLAREKRN